MKTILPAVLLLAVSAAAKGPATPFRVLIDNERVKVSKFEAKPGDKIPRHQHPDHLVYALRGCTVLFGAPDGKTTETKIAKGQALYLKGPIDHTVEVVGSSACDLLSIDLK